MDHGLTIRIPNVPYSTWWLFAFLIGEIGCQLALLSTFFSRIRVLVRTATFVASLGLLLAFRRHPDSHPSWKAALIAIAVVAAGMLRVESDNGWASVATVLLYAAVLAPIFWIPRVRVDTKTVRQVFLLLWGFHTTSVLFGILQVYFPGQFQPTISSVLEEQGQYVDSLQIVLGNGALVFRPMGLTDVPGGAANDAFYSIILGIGLLLDRPRPSFRLAIGASMLLDFFMIYLCEVRSTFVMVAVCVLALMVPFALQRRLARAMTMLVIASGVAVLGFVMALAVAEQSVSDRFTTLLAANPSAVYYDNRGIFLQQTFYDLLPRYPFGAGLGRWGMVNRYFSAHSRFEPLWAEIQWTAWLYDGGVLLMAAYALAVGTALTTALRIARREGPLQNWATLMFGYCIGAIAVTFNSCDFSSTAGLDFWFLNATLYAAHRQMGEA